jgi:phospholipase C
VAYPIKAGVSVKPGDSASVVTFRPAAAGLVTVTANCFGDLSNLPHRPPGEPELVSLEVRLEAFRPGSATAALSRSGQQPNAQKDDNLIVWGSAPASESDLNGDWVVQIANTGDVPVNCTVTVRYQTIPGNLGKIDHIVVLMMENRSFDHMLGYLSLPGGRADIEGLKGTEFNDDAGIPAPTKFPVHHLTATQFLSDPGHGWRDVKAQLTADTKAGLASNGGFIKNFAQQLANQQSDQKQPVGDIMGYYDGSEVNVYDLLAREFTICQRWFASLPSDTFPNRSYALTGGLDPQLLGSDGLPTTPSTDGVMKSPPAYTRKTIFEFLRDSGIEWTIYFDFGIPFGLMFKAFAQDAYYTQRMRWLEDFPAQDFISKAKTGDLPPVSWIDPYFSDVPHAPSTANDDHPAGNISRGQYLVGRIYNALASGPAWAKTLLVITYDEHGGFFDHVLPPGSSDPGNSDPNSPKYDPKCDPNSPQYDLAQDVPSAGGPQDDNPSFARYGVRVPAFVISAWAQRGGVSNETFDHTSILRTILLRFCSPAGQTAPSMGKRTDTASDLGSLLSGEIVRDQPPQASHVTVPDGGPATTAIKETPGQVLRAAALGF